MVSAQVMVLTRDESLRGSHSLSAWMARRTKSRGPKGLQLKVRARRAPRFLVPFISSAYIQNFLKIAEEYFVRKARKEGKIKCLPIAYHLHSACIMHSYEYFFCIYAYIQCIMQNGVFSALCAVIIILTAKILHEGCCIFCPRQCVCVREFWSVSVWNVFQKWRMFIKVKQRCHKWLLKYGVIHESYMLPTYFRFLGNNKTFRTFKLYCW